MIVNSVSTAANSGPGLPGDRAGLEIGEDVQPEGGIGLRVSVEQAVLDHVPDDGVTLLARLEHEFDCAGQFVAMARLADPGGLGWLIGAPLLIAIVTMYSLTSPLSGSGGATH
jgi:hypothetical protein